MKKLSLMVKYIFITPWCPIDRVEWYNVIILSTNIFGIANNTVSFSGVVTNLNNNESSNIYFYANISTLQIAVFVLGNLFWAKYKCYRVHRDTRWISGLSHQSSNLSCLCNPLWEAVIHALLDTGIKGMQVVTYPANCQTTKVILTKVFPKVWVHAHE